MNIINLPYCFLFIPLIFSGLNILQNYKTTNTVITIGVVSSILLLGFYLIPEVLPNVVLQNKVNDNILFIMGEYKVDLKNLIFLILIFFTKLISFMFFDDKTISEKKLNFFFAICGILLTNNIFNMFIYIEFYSFSLYNLMSDYRQMNYTRVAYKYYNNGVVGSILFMFFVFMVYFTFGTPDIDYIVSHLDTVKNNYIYNLSIFVFIGALIFKFFSFNFYFSGVLKSSDITNLLFINILFSDIVIGIYILWKFLYSVFNLDVIFGIFHLNYLFYIVGSILVIYSSCRIMLRKNMLPTVYSFSLIVLGYVVILMGINNSFSFVSVISFLINHVLINFLFYLIVALCIFLFGKSDTPIIYSFSKYKYIVYAVVLSKMAFPIAFGFNSYWNFVLSVVESKTYYLFVPFIVEKVVMIFLFARYYFVFCKEAKGESSYIELENKISLNTNYMMAIFIMFFLVIVISFLEGIIGDILFDFVLSGGK